MRITRCAALACVLVVAFSATAHGMCDFYNKHCIYEDGITRCYFKGDGFDSEPLDVFLSQNLGSTASNNTGCPQMSSGNQPIEIFLEACSDQQDVNLPLQTRIQDIKQGSYNDAKQCTRTPNHTITSALLSDPAVVHFGGGVMIASSDTFNQDGGFVDANATSSLSFNGSTTGRPRCNEVSSSHKARIVRKPGIDGTCNVVRTGHNNVELHDLILDNTECVEFAVGDNIAGALETFGPDTLEVVRVSKLFDSVDPTGFMARYIKLKTFEKYRTAYPGRALMSVDSKDSTKYPPEPVNINGACFSYVEDAHRMVGAGGYVAPFSDSDEVPAILNCNNTKNYTKFSLGNRCYMNSPVNGTVDDKYLTYPGCAAPGHCVELDCPVNTKNANITMILNPDTKRTSEPTCIPANDFVSGGERCPSNHRLEAPENIPFEIFSNLNIGNLSDPNQTTVLDGNVTGICVPDMLNNIASRPIDLILWDFQGSVVFANKWPATAGVVFTVLVFADRNETLIAQHKDGQVFEDYFNTSAVSDLGIFLPDPHVTLLDVSDFYDVAQDEFNCFDKPQPECPNPDLTLPTVIVLAGLTALAWLHHFMTTPKFELGCTISEEYEEREEAGEIPELMFEEDDYAEKIPLETILRRRVSKGVRGKTQ